MRTRNRTLAPTPLHPTQVHPGRPHVDHRPSPARPVGCRPCADGHDHCHGTLVLHADGSAECDDAGACEVREDLHEWWVACVELGCGCTGDEQDEPSLLLAA